MEVREIEEKERVCVTGAGGFIASWLVKFLLSKGYMVHGTVREPSDEKNAHLKKLENASENLQLFKTDLLDYEGLCAAIAGCTGVIHVACPVPAGSVPNPEVDLIEPAVVGTRNVLGASLKAKVRRVVVVSSIAAVGLNPNWPKNQAMDEKCWSDKEFCKATKNYYCLAKTMAESEALDYAEKSELDIVTVCPSIVLGPMLQTTINASSLLLLALLKGFFFHSIFQYILSEGVGLIITQLQKILLNSAKLDVNKYETQPTKLYSTGIPSILAGYIVTPRKFGRYKFAR